MFGRRIAKHVKRFKVRHNVKGFGIIDPPDLTKAMEDYVYHLAAKLGVPPWEIDQDVVKKWAEGWAKAFTKPEEWPEIEQEVNEESEKLFKQLSRLKYKSNRKEREV